MRWSRTFSILAVGFILGTFGSSAHAFERQWHAGVDLGLAALSWNEEVHGGIGGGIHLAYGLTDSYNLMVEMGGSSHAIYADRPALLATHGGAGVAYTLDVIRWVPYMGLLVGGYRFSGVDLEQAEYKLGFQGALGLDYRPSRDWAVGVQLRYHTFSDAPLEAHYLTSFGRFELLWGW